MAKSYKLIDMVDLASMKEIVKFATPIVILQTALAAFLFVDLFFIGKLGTEELAAGGLVTNTLFPFLYFGIGCVLGFDTICSQALGAGDQKTPIDALIHTVIFSLMVSIPLCLLLGFAEPVYRLFLTEEKTIALSMEYLNSARWVLIPGLLFVATRQYLQAIGVSTQLLVMAVVCNLLNVFLNYTMVLGNFGVPKMGISGSGWATVFSNLFLFLSALAISRGFFKKHKYSLSSFKWNPAMFKQLISLGVPAGLHLFLETVMLFTLMIFVGRIGSTALAAHSIVNNFSLVLYNLPIGISFAAVVKVGNAVGAQDTYNSVKQAVNSLVVSVAYWAVSLVVFYVFASQIVHLYSEDQVVTDLAMKAFVLWLAFNLPDSIQVVMSAILRGMGDTKLPAYANLAGFGLITIPLAYFLTFTMKMSIVGIWIGWGSGVTAIAAVLVYAWYKKKDDVKSIVETTPVASDQSGGAERKVG